MLKRKATTFIKNWLDTRTKNAWLSREPDKRGKHISSSGLRKRTLRNCLKLILSRCHLQWIFLLEI